MNTPYVVFDLTTGEPLRWGQCQVEVLAEQAGDGETALATSALTVDGNRLIVWHSVKEHRDMHINGGAQTPFGAVDSDDLARANISGAALGALISKSTQAPYEITWTMLDNGTVNLDADQMIGLGVAVLTHVEACHAQARNFRTQIEAATNMAELLAIDAGVGWPTV